MKPGLSPVELRYKAAQLRRNIVAMMGANKAHHFGGSLSAADIVTTLYFYAMDYDAANPAWEARDRFILSKGHCVPAQYAALAMLGVFPLEELATLKQMGTRLQGHPAAHLLPGIEGCTGSLGHGLVVCQRHGAGLAYSRGALSRLLPAGRRRDARGAGVGGRAHGAVAVPEQPDRDHRPQPAQGHGPLLLRGRLADLPAKWAAFGWRVLEVDGHDVSALCDALDWAQGEGSAPALIIADTVKGKGVSFMEDQPLFHNAVLTAAQLETALAELDHELALAGEAR